MTAIAWDGQCVVTDSARGAANGTRRITVRKIRLFSKPIALSRNSTVLFTACVGSGASREIDGTYFLIDELCTTEFGVSELLSERKKYMGIQAGSVRFNDLCNDFYLIGTDNGTPVLYKLGTVKPMKRHLSGSGSALLKHEVFEFMATLNAVDMVHAMTLVESGTCGYPLIKYNPATGKLTEIAKASDAKKRQLKKLFMNAVNKVACKFD